MSEHDEYLVEDDGYTLLERELIPYEDPDLFDGVGEYLASIEKHMYRAPRASWPGADYTWEPDFAWAQPGYVMRLFRPAGYAHML